MKGRSKRIIAILSVAVMLVGQCGSVLAEEVTNSVEVVEASEIGIDEEVVEETTEVATEVATEIATEAVVEAATEVTTEATTEVVTEDLANMPMLLAEDLEDEPMLLAEEATTLLAPTNVKWTAGYTGITFDNPNTEEVWLIAVLYSGDGTYQTYTSYHTGYSYDWGVDTYFSEFMRYAGDYYVTLYVVSGELSDGEAYSAYKSSDYKASTEVFTYTCPEQIAIPSNINFYLNGIVTWDAVDGASGYNVYLYNVSKGEKNLVTIYPTSETACNVSYNMPDIDTNTYSVTVQTISGDMTKYSSSDESAMIEWQPSGVMPAEVVTDLKWSDETPGKVEFYNPNLQEVSFQVHVKNGEKIVSWWETSADAPRTVTLNTFYDIEESGDYTFEVKTYPYGEETDGDFTTGAVSICSEVYTYVKPDKQIATPSNIQWSETEAGVVTWDAIDGACSYLARLYDVTDGALNHVSGYYSSATSRNFIDKMAEGKSYAVQIRAFSKNIEEATHSAESKLVYLDASKAVEEVNNTLSAQVDSLTSNSSVADVQAATDAIKSEFADSKNNLQYAMQTNDETQSQIAKLETLYEEKLGITSNTNVAEDTGIDADKVSLLGASLNATQAGEVSFNMTKPDVETQKDLITHSRFNNAICFSMDLEGAGVEPGNLAIPVTVTMPCPAGININKLCIIHYAADGSSEYLDVRKNADGTISFTVTHFSEFVFGEVESSATETKTEGGSKKIEKPWTPTTEDEKERYSYFSREKVSYIVGTEGGYKAKLVNTMQGRLFFNSVEAAVADYTIARTYNVEVDGKLVCETAMPAMFILDIPEAYLAENREYKMVCVSQNGEVSILEDLDMDADTITFLTNKYYAFALVYKDTIME